MKSSRTINNSPKKDSNVISIPNATQHIGPTRIQQSPKIEKPIKGLPRLSKTKKEKNWQKNVKTPFQGYAIKTNFEVLY